jgi:NAD dependent epimerase/dehydratase family.
MIAIIGASGFIGRHLQVVISSDFSFNKAEVLMVYFNQYYNIDNSFKRISFDDFIKAEEYYDCIKNIIIVSGNSNRNIILNNFNEALKKDTEHIIALKDKFNANIILLSSAAVYDGCLGTVSEDTIIYPDSIYGIFKYNSEMTAKYIINNMRNKKLIIYRLMYAFGEYERENRLLPILAKQKESDNPIPINGYENYINPLSGNYVAKILLASALKIDLLPYFDVVNLSSIQKVKIMDIISLLNNIKTINYYFNSKEPELKYLPSTVNLEKYIKLLNIDNFNMNEALLSYFMKIE